MLGTPVGDFREAVREGFEKSYLGNHLEFYLAEDMARPKLESARMRAETPPYALWH